MVQLLSPIVITSSVIAIGSGRQNARTSETVHLQNAAFVWVPVLIVPAAIAWFGQNNLKTASSSFAQQKVIFRRKHTWVMTWLYVGTFGSFIGFAAALPMLIKTAFPACSVATYAWTGPALGALARWAGGWIADRIGGARVTILSFVGMAASTTRVIEAAPQGPHRRHPGVHRGPAYGFSSSRPCSPTSR
ncbi:hypothetical protein [Streptomyces sp. S.PB5]|uniref:hypothetical protein n=1 Tax=Streptomyces sp. S.PB5 TaxID=3020844 RepID=UPI0025B26B80|nr:hypothetical protein [Streptomyces sp. S.PB5]MDN3025274.1 hypothetical protein [Streptomyces sp. S.PB5]